MSDCTRFGKTGLQPDAIHTRTPVDLRLAEILEHPGVALNVEEAAAAELRRLHAENEALRADAERYRWLRSKSKETLLNPKGAASEFLPDMRTHWQMPVLICSGPIGGYLEFDAAIDAAMKGQP